MNTEYSDGIFSFMLYSAAASRRSGEFQQQAAFVHFGAERDIKNLRRLAVYRCVLSFGGALETLDRVSLDFSASGQRYKAVYNEQRPNSFLDALETNDDLLLGCLDSSFCGRNSAVDSRML